MERSPDDELLMLYKSYYFVRWSKNKLTLLVRPGFQYTTQSLSSAVSKGEGVCVGEVGSARYTRRHNFPQLQPENESSIRF